MPKAWRSSYNLAFKLKLVAEAVDNKSAITRDNGSLLAKRSGEPLPGKTQVNGELKMSAKRTAKGCHSPKYPELDNNTGLVFRAEKSR